MDRGTRKVLDDLKAARILVLHPKDEDGDALINQLRRIGCDARAAWPVPAELPKTIDTVFVAIEKASPQDHAWLPETQGLVIIGIVEYESPTSLKALLDWNAQGVVNKPIRPFGILSSLTMARALGGYYHRLENKIRKLEQTLKARREIEKATRILMQMKHVSESEAYALLRQQATAKRMALAEIAVAIITMHETMDGLGLTPP
jgi:two-component system, response regulator PdtaR